MNERCFQHVAVLKGGISTEREVSLESGAAIAAGLRAAGYTVYELDVTSRTIDLPREVEAVFIALHGTFGEDGGVQLLLTQMGVPFVGAGVEASRMAFDKQLTDICLRAAGVPVPDIEVVRKERQPVMQPPVAVKPLRQGSSVGCSLVFEAMHFPAALEKARQYGEEIIVQRFIPGREFTVSIVAGEVLPPVEIVLEEGWYDYDAKYKTDSTRYIVPAKIDAETEVRMRELAFKTFHSLGARGFGRVDFRMTPAGELFVLELNTIPGFTAHSLMPKAAAAAGIGFSELCDRIMRTALMP
ncbi:MAG: D-alanine--D-alanine ligase [Kiritimatiellales bacterium]